eukprot:1195189-Prorocentrum_minimum.AAC.2
MELSRLMYRARIGEYVDTRMFLRHSFRERKEASKVRVRSPQRRCVPALCCPNQDEMRFNETK